MEQLYLKISSVKQGIIDIIVVSMIFTILQAISFIFIFDHFDVAIVTFFTTLLFVCSFFAIKSEQIDMSIIIIHIAITMHVFYMIFVFGWDCGYQYFIISSIGFFYVNSFDNKYLAHIISCCEAIIFILAYVFVNVFDLGLEYEMVAWGINFDNILYIINTIVSVAGLFIFTHIVSNNYLKHISEQSEQNKILEHNAKKDMLTGLNTRNALIDNINNHSEANTPFYFAVVDIDWFKNVNDKYGHQIGDEVLKTLAIIMQDIFGANNICRWGGEEFVIFGAKQLENECDGFDFLRKLEYLRTEFGTHDFNINNHKFNVSISIGCVSVYEKSDVVSKINLADVCLYEAKNSGKNKIIFKEYSIDESSFKYKTIKK